MEKGARTFRYGPLLELGSQPGCSGTRVSLIEADQAKLAAISVDQRVSARSMVPMNVAATLAVAAAVSVTA